MGRLSSSVAATFVFTDLVESTAIAARVGPAGAEELRQKHFGLLRGAVAASGGTEVKNLGDGLMVMYLSPSRALAGAVGMQQAVEHHNRSTDELLAVRIGISTGEATEEDGDYFGDPVVEAARLCAAANGGQILATQLVRLTVGRHASQTFVELGGLTLKGLPEPVVTVEVVWEPTSASGSVPLPGRLVGAASDALFGFFGRGEELTVLGDVRKRAQSTGRAQAVFIAGEAGMGKTTLAAQVARAAHDEGTVVLFGHADEDLGVAYQPWIEVLSMVAGPFDDDLDALPSAQRAALARLMPSTADAAGRVSDPDTERLLLLEGTTALLAAASQRGPLLVVLDDLHWADTASLQLLRHVIGSTVGMVATVVCTYRDTDLSGDDPLNRLLADLHGETNVARVRLVGLDDIDLVELIAAAAGHDLDDAAVGLAHALRRETDGNPFFTGEMLRHLGESGAIVQSDDGRWTVSGELDQLGLPTSVRDVVGRRVERLGSETRRVLRLAAVIGRDFDLTLLAEVADIDDDPLLDLLDAAVAAAVLVEGDAPDDYRFAHALIQHSLYDELSTARRQRAHQRIAETLEAQTVTQDAATLAELARHWIAATRPADIDKALDYIQRAGDAARDALAPDDAIRWYQQALDLLDRQPAPDQHRQAQLLADLGTAQGRAAHPDYRDTLLEAAAIAQRLNDTVTLVNAALGFTQWATGNFGDHEAKEVIQAALDRMDPEPTPTKARLLAALANAHDASLEWQTRRDLSLQAVAIARQSDDDATFVDVIDTTLLALATPDHRDRLVDDVARAVAMANRIGDPVLRARITFQSLWARYQQADVGGADTDISEMETLADVIGLPYQRWQLALVVAGQLLRSGHADRSEIANEHALEIGTAAGIPEALATFGGLLVQIRMQQGRLDEIVDFVIDAARENPSIAVLRAGVAFMLCEIGRIEEARERLSAEAARGFDFPYDGTWLTSMSHLADGAAITGDHASARTLVDLIAPFAGQVVSPAGVILWGAIARPLAHAATLVGDYDRAEGWFATAHDIHDRLRAPFWTALGQLDHADLCLARLADGDLGRGRDLVTSASGTAAKYGYVGLTKRAAAILDAV